MVLEELRLIDAPTDAEFYGGIAAGTAIAVGIGVIVALALC
jgi:hypothetical protein